MSLQSAPALRRTSQQRRSHAPPSKQARCRWPTAALAVVAVGSVCCGFSFGCFLRALRDRNGSEHDAAGPPAAAAVDELVLVKRFQSFEEYAEEMMGNTKAPPVPFVDPPTGWPEGSLTLPLATIIGVQVLRGDPACLVLERDGFRWSHGPVLRVVYDMACVFRQNASTRVRLSPTQEPKKQQTAPFALENSTMHTR